MGSLCSWFASAIFTEADHAACGDVPVVLLTKATTCCTGCVASVAVMLQVSATVAACVMHVCCSSASKCGGCRRCGHDCGQMCVADVSARVPATCALVGG